nr:hypothetical protein [Pseudomonas sp.]
MESIQTRAKALIDKAGFERLIKETEISLTRWQTVRYKKIRMSTEEIEALIKIFPEYAMWLACGGVAPESGQTSPEYDEANRNLSQPHAG